MQPPVREGDVLAGKYRVERVLGAGGMGVVVAALHLQLEQRVAIKFLLPDALANAEVVARFLREARAAVRIQSEHVARVIDVGELPGGLPYMVMEYLDGSDLGGVLRAQGTLPVEAAVEYVLQACEAIAEAHAGGIVHRDIKPANLFLARRADGSETIKVLDFGISKTTAPGGSSSAELSLTKTSALMGSPLYMSPEQMRSSRQVDARTDIWSLGMLLYELLAGRTAFVADSMPELCALILTEAPPALASFRPDVAPGLQTAVMRCLDKDPARRFPSVAELAHALVPFAPRRAHISAERASRFSRTGSLPGSSEAVAGSAAGIVQGHTNGGMAETAASWAPADTRGARTRGGSNLRIGLIAGGVLAGALALLAATHLRSGSPVNETLVVPSALPSPAVAATPSEQAAGHAPEMAPAASAVPVASAVASAPPLVLPIANVSHAGTPHGATVTPHAHANSATPAPTPPPAAPSPPAVAAPAATPAAAPAKHNPLNIEIK